MGGKLLEVLKEIAPGTNVVAIILSSASPGVPRHGMLPRLLLLLLACG